MTPCIWPHAGIKFKDGIEVKAVDQAAAWINLHTPDLTITLFPPYKHEKKLYSEKLEDISKKIKQNFQFKAKSVYILFTPFKKIIKIG